MGAGAEGDGAEGDGAGAADGGAAAGGVRLEADEQLSAIVDSMPKAVDARRATEILGVARSPTVERMIADYIEDFNDACVVCKKQPPHAARL